MIVINSDLPSDTKYKRNTSHTSFKQRIFCFKEINMTFYFFSHANSTLPTNETFNFIKVRIIILNYLRTSVASHFIILRKCIPSYSNLFNYFVRSPNATGMCRVCMHNVLFSSQSKISSDICLHVLRIYAYTHYALLLVNLKLLTKF